MPKVGMEPIRRAALVKAAIERVGAAGSLDVTVAQVAQAAGVSAPLAHHYFGGKEALFEAAMRAILTEY
ncbi:MAG: TetR family transcriptional regulator, partial [Pseudomonadota bacterium]